MSEFNVNFDATALFGSGDIDGLIKCISDKANGINSIFMLEDTLALKKTGKYSDDAPVMAAAMKIKPILSIDSEGKFVTVSKQRGVNFVLQYMADKVSGNLGDKTKVLIGHANVPEKASTLKELIAEKCSQAEISVVTFSDDISEKLGKGAVAVLYF